MEAVSSDKYRVVVSQRTTGDVYDVFVQVLGASTPSIAVFDGPDLIVRPKDEATAYDVNEDSMFSFTGALKDDMMDMFFTIALALGHKESGFEDGLLHGENRVLWEWVKSFRGDPIRPAAPKLGGGVSHGSGSSISLHNVTS